MKSKHSQTHTRMENEICEVLRTQQSTQTAPVSVLRSFVVAHTHTTKEGGEGFVGKSENFNGKLKNQTTVWKIAWKSFEKG